jgi:hypothetical protein
MARSPISTAMSKVVLSPMSLPRRKPLPDIAVLIGDLAILVDSSTTQLLGVTFNKLTDNGSLVSWRARLSTRLETLLTPPLVQWSDALSKVISASLDARSTALGRLIGLSTTFDIAVLIGDLAILVDSSTTQLLGVTFNLRREEGRWPC